jgi:hypothetical protein
MGTNQVCQFPNTRVTLRQRIEKGSMSGDPNAMLVLAQKDDVEGIKKALASGTNARWVHTFAASCPRVVRLFSCGRAHWFSPVMDNLWRLSSSLDRSPSPGAIRPPPPDLTPQKRLQHSSHRWARSTQSSLTPLSKPHAALPMASDRRPSTSLAFGATSGRPRR